MTGVGWVIVSSFQRMSEAGDEVLLDSETPAELDAVRPGVRVAGALSVVRFEVHLAHFDPLRGVRSAQRADAWLISPNEMNRHLRTLIVAP